MFFRDNYARAVKIKFLGVWDTVGALDIPIESFEWFNKAYYEFHDTELSGIVENAFHALAVDEYRENFSPTLWAPSTQPNQRMEQVWLVGAHANVGGGYEEEQLSDIALAWMQERATSCGLAIVASKIPQLTAANCAGSVQNSFDEFMCGFYRVMHSRYFRKIGNTDFGNEQVHLSVAERLNSVTTYRPRNPVGAKVSGVRNPSQWEVVVKHRYHREEFEMAIEVNGVVIATDDQGYLVDPETWNDAVAEKLAQQAGIQLSDEHRKILQFIRNYFDQHRLAADARFVMKYLEDELGYKDNASQRLYELFPYGYMQQVCKIAGMRRPRAWSTG